MQYLLTYQIDNVIKMDFIFSFNNSAVPAYFEIDNVIKTGFIFYLQQCTCLLMLVASPFVSKHW